MTASLRGVEVDWRLFTGDEPAVLVSVANGGFAGSTSIEDLQVTVTQAENGEPLKISGTAARAGDPNLVSAADVKFEAHTDYKLPTSAPRDGNHRRPNHAASNERYCLNFSN